MTQNSNIQRIGTLTVEDITAILAGQKSDARFSANKEFQGHECIVYAYDPSIDFQAIIAVHNTNRGQALGGCRYYTCYNDLDDAATDVLRLSRGMTYKNSTANLDLGGGKSVLIGPKDKARPTEAMMKALGQTVESLQGRYVTAEDMNTSEEDMMTVFSQTRHVCGIPLAKLATDKFPAGFDTKTLPGANPSPYTAYGTLMGIMAAVKHKMGREDLKDVRVAVKGAGGAVGSDLCRLLSERGAKLVVSDWDGNADAQARLAALAEKYGATVTTSAEIMGADVDVYAPCAKGADINDDTIPQLKAKIVAGCANNVLAEPRHADMLRQKGILYAPDYVINAGGVICAGTQHLWFSQPENYPVPTHDGVLKHIDTIYDVLGSIFALAEEEGRDTASIADKVSENGFSVRKFFPLAA